MYYSASQHAITCGRAMSVRKNFMPAEYLKILRRLCLLRMTYGSVYLSKAEGFILNALGIILSNLGVILSVLGVILSEAKKLS